MKLFQKINSNVQKSMDIYFGIIYYQYDFKNLNFINGKPIPKNFKKHNNACRRNFIEKIRQANLYNWHKDFLFILSGN